MKYDGDAFKTVNNKQPYRHDVTIELSFFLHYRVETQL